MSMGKSLAVLPIKTPLGFYFYETNRNEIVAINEELYDYICAVINGNMDMIRIASKEIKKDYEYLEECGYLQAYRIKEIEHPLTKQVGNLLARKMDKITLQITQNCNLRCTYCIYSENLNLGQRSHSQNVMSFETAQKSLDFYRNHSIDSEQISIGFYGGEPLMEFELIKKIVRYSESIFEGRKIIYSVTTNATLLTDTIIEYLVENRFNVLVSLDGPKEIQNRNRKFPSGQGSFDIAISNIRKLSRRMAETDKEISISMVIDSKTLYSELIKLFDVPDLKTAELLYTYVEEDAQYVRPNEKYIEEYNYDLFLGMLSLFRKNGTSSYLSKIVERDILAFNDGNERFKPNVLGIVAAPSGPCIPGKVRMFVNCFGELYPCERVNEDHCMQIGTIESGINVEKAEQLLNIGQLTSNSCRKCWAFSLCTICAKRIEVDGKLSRERKMEVCKEAKNIAYNKIMNKILVYENEIHAKKRRKSKT